MTKPIEGIIISLETMISSSYDPVSKYEREALTEAIDALRELELFREMHGRDPEALVSVMFRRIECELGGLKGQQRLMRMELRESRVPP